MFLCVCCVCVAHLSVVLPSALPALTPPFLYLHLQTFPFNPLLLSFLFSSSRTMCDNGDLEDKPPAPPVRMSSTIFSGGGKDHALAANHSSKPLPSVPEERKRNKIISIFSGAEKGAYANTSRSFKACWAAII